jgi:hypothetical protein
MGNGEYIYDQTAPSAEELWSESPRTEDTMARTHETDPSIRVGTCGHATTIYSAHYPMCSTCGFKANHWVGGECFECDAITSDYHHDVFLCASHLPIDTCRCEKCQQAWCDAQG